MRYINIFLIYMKRWLKNLSFLIAGLIVLIAIPAIANINVSQTEGFKTGFYCNGNQGLSAALVNAEGEVEFIPYTSQKELERDIENQSLNCGYIIPEDISDDIINKKRGSIICLISPSSVLVEVVNEALFAEMARLYAVDIAEYYLQKEGIDYSDEKLINYYNDYLDNGKAISIEYRYFDNKYTQSDIPAVNNNSLSGLLAIYIMLGGVMGVNMWLKDEKKGVPFGIMNVVAATLILSMFAVIAAVTVEGINVNNILKLAVYDILIIAFCIIIKTVFGKQSLICGLLPVLVLGSVIICPVFVDIAAILPPIKAVRYIFPPYYYISDIRAVLIGLAAYLAVVVIIKLFLYGIRIVK